MFELILESSMVGIIIMVIGTIIFNLTINKKNRDKNKPYGINMSFFMTGFITNLLLEFCGFNSYMCNKKSATKIMFLSKLC